MALAAVLFLPVLLAAQPAAAQTAGDPWWGPSDRARPTEGWAVRIPIVLENKHAFAVGPLVTVDVDFAAALVAAGWTSQQMGAEARLRGFTLDVDSLRLVRYHAGFAAGPIGGAQTPPTPHLFYKAPLDAARHRGEFDPATNPTGTLLFSLGGLLAPGQKAYYYLYANPLEYGKTPPAGFRPQELAPLENYLWGNPWGTVFYGYEPQQGNRAHALQLMAHPQVVDSSLPVTITVYVANSLGAFVPMESTATFTNPVRLAPSSSFSGDGMLRGVVSPPQGKHFKLVATQPIRVLGYGLNSIVLENNVPQYVLTTDSATFVAGEDGSFASSRFLVHNLDGIIEVYKASPGAVTVRNAFGDEVRLTDAQPNAFLNMDGDPGLGWYPVVTANPDQRILVSYPKGQTVRPQTVPSFSGGARGSEFLAEFPRDGGYLHLCPEGKTSLRITSVERPTVQVYPDGSLDSTPPAVLTPRTGCHRVTSETAPDGLNDAFLVDDPRYPVEGGPAPFRLIEGSVGRDMPELERPAVGPWGGVGGIDFEVEGAVAIYGHYNHTRITVFEEDRFTKAETNRSLPSVSRDGIVTFAPDLAKVTGRYRIVTTKPVSVQALAPAQDYARFVPGRPEMPEVILGDAQYRGPLVDLRMPDVTGRQKTITTGPGSPVTARFEVHNLGRWIGGADLSDTIVLTCVGPSEWTIQGCDREVALGSASAERVEVVVTTTAEDVNTTKYVRVEARSRSGASSAAFNLGVYTEIRYGVALTFDTPGGRKTIDPPIGVDPGGSYTYTLVIQNTGSAEDTFRLRVDEPKEGWTQSLLLDGEEIGEVRLAGGESAILHYRVTAPDQETAPQNLVSILAESRSSELASAKAIVNAATRIRPKVSIALTLDPPTRVAEPNETAVFNLTVRNSGNDIFRILFARQGLLPEGWNATLGVDEIDLGPGEPFTFPLQVTPPAGARAGDLVTVKVAASTDAGGGTTIPGDEVAAVVVVKRIHNLTLPNLADAEAAPGERLAYVLPLTNHGNGDDEVELLPGAASEWPVSSEEGGLFLPLGQTGDLRLLVDVPAGTPPGLYNVTVSLRLSREEVQEVVVPVQVQRVARLSFAGAAAVDLVPGRASSLAYTAKNDGNVEGTFTLALGAPDGWTARFAPPTVRLRPGQSAEVVAFVNASRDAPDGPAGLTVRATLDGADAGARAVAARVARPALYVASVSTNGDLSPGDILVVSATIGNRGDIAAENVSVALVVDGATVDQVVLSRVTSGERQIATLNWLSTKRNADVRVVIDPQEELVLQTRDGSAAEVTFGSRLGIPALPALVLPLLALALALALPRRRRA